MYGYQEFPWPLWDAAASHQCVSNPLYDVPYIRRNELVNLPRNYTARRCFAQDSLVDPKILHYSFQGWEPSFRAVGHLYSVHIQLVESFEAYVARMSLTL